MRKIAIFGATSRIALETARLFAVDGDSLFLISRNEEQLKTAVEDLRARGAGQVEFLVADASKVSNQPEILNSLDRAMPGTDTVLIAYGLLGDQSAAEKDFSVAREIIEVNFLSVAALVTEFGNRFEKIRSGSITVISSVAGERGRKSNYCYGTAKAALNIFLQGLRNRLSASNVHVLTVKPGFVDTPMTAHIPKNALFASPAVVGQSIYNAMVKKRDIAYTPWYWQIVMTIIKAIPERIFKRMSI